VNNIGFNEQVIVQKISAIGVIRPNTANLGSGQKDIVRAFVGKEISDGGLVSQDVLAKMF
jgi:hypothetical protein